LFYGQYFSSIDENNRVEIPAGFRELLGGRVVITQGFDRNIMALPVEAFQDLSKLVTALNIANPLARGLLRMLLGNASYVDIDQSGVISLTGSLKEFAKLGSEVVLVGQGKYIEVWSQALWHQQQIDLQDAEANSERFISMNLAGL
jgi:MraZ protein